MKILATSILEHPRKTVYEAYRDELPDVAEYIPNIDQIEVLEREDTDGGATLHNLWHAKASIPSVAKAFIKPDMLKWEDYATWRNKKYECAWTLETHVFPDSVTCEGVTRFEADGRKRTRVILEGNLKISLSRVPGVPRILARSIAPQIEKFVVALIKPNLTRVSTALGEYLDEVG